MGRNSLINNDSSLSGCYRAIARFDHSKNETKVYIPSLMNNIDGSNYKNSYNILNKASWASIRMYELAKANNCEEIQCFVSYDIGDGKNPIILSYFGKGLDQANSWGGDGAMGSGGSGSYGGSGASGSYTLGASGGNGKILIIAGHDKVNNSSRGAYGDEADLTRELSQEVQNALNALKANICDTYPENLHDVGHSFYGDLKNGNLNVNYANYSGALEIHFNSGSGAFSIVRNERINGDTSIDKAIADACQSVGFSRSGEAVVPVKGYTNYDTLQDIEAFNNAGKILHYVEVANMNSSTEMSTFKRVKGELGKKIAKILYDAYGANFVDTGSNVAGGGLQNVVNEAKKYLGVPYVYGGTSPSGFDCSGLVVYVYKQCGINVQGRTTNDLYAEFQHISREQLQPGDAVFFGSDIHHMGIYIGDNKYIHAPQTGDVVKISEMTRRDFMGGGRPS